MGYALMFYCNLRDCFGSSKQLKKHWFCTQQKQLPIFPEIASAF